MQADSTGRIETYNRFGGFGFGGPGGGRQGAINFSVDNIVELKVRQVTDTAVNLKKVKIFDSFRLGTSYNFAADSLQLAPIQLSGRTTFTNNFSLLFGAQLEPTTATRWAAASTPFAELAGQAHRDDLCQPHLQRQFEPPAKAAPAANPLDAREEHELAEIRRRMAGASLSIGMCPTT